MTDLNYGLDADLKAKQEAKYDVGLEQEVTKWIEDITGEKKEGTFADWLKDGKVLCALANKIKEGSVKKINQQSMPFKQMENITYFMNAARDMGVPETSLFGTPDLYEAKNIGSVVNGIYAYGGAVQANAPEFTGPTLGTKLTTESKAAARTNRVCADQSAGLAKAMEVERPKDGSIVRGGAATASTTTAGSTPSPSQGDGGAGYAAAQKAPVYAEKKDDCTYGLDADLKAKQEAKFDSALEGEVITWIETIIGEKKGDQTLQEWLKDGAILCKLANAVKPGSVKKVNESSLAFKQMENITFFMNAARDMGVPESQMFGTPDLYEDKNMGTVVTGLFAYGGAIQVAMPDFNPKLGVAMVESKDTKRTGGLCTDASGGFAAKMEVQRPNEHLDSIVR
jgi:hypothetical protein